MKNYNLKNMVTLTKSMVANLAFIKSDDDLEAPITAKFDPGNTQLVLITGENATGKSLFRKMYYSILKSINKIEVIHLSQQGKSSSGIPSALIYGDESYNSTGYLSARTVVTGIKTCRERENSHYIIFDEPDIGLSDSYAAAVGIEIRKFVENLPEMTKGVVIITHNKTLVKQLLPVNPSHLRLGDCPDLNSWLTKETEPGNIEDLFTRNNEIFQSVLKLTKD
jgi:hypothetical protein